MHSPINSLALDQLFTKARSNHNFLPKPIEEETLRELFDLVKLGPTAFNAQPARFLFIRTEQAKQRLAPAMASTNRDKTAAAPVNVVVAWDTRFPEHLPELFPIHDAKAFFDANPGWVESSGTSNAYLQAAYLIIAARALGLDAGPMSGFSPDAVNREFFPDGRYRALMVINLGYSDQAELPERLPRMAFDQAVELV